MKKRILIFLIILCCKHVSVNDYKPFFAQFPLAVGVPPTATKSHECTKVVVNKSRRDLLFIESNLL